jgi:hypothetical protein
MLRAGELQTLSDLKLRTLRAGELGTLSWEEGRKGLRAGELQTLFVTLGGPEEEEFSRWEEV